jgi:hypothetical protein
MYRLGLSVARTSKALRERTQRINERWETGYGGHVQSASNTIVVAKVSMFVVLAGQKWKSSISFMADTSAMERHGWMCGYAAPSAERKQDGGEISERQHIATTNDPRWIDATQRG